MREHRGDGLGEHTRLVRGRVSQPLPGPSPPAHRADTFGPMYPASYTAGARLGHCDDIAVHVQELLGGDDEVLLAGTASEGQPGRVDSAAASEQWNTSDSITIRANRSGKLWSQDPDQWRALCTPQGCPWCHGPGPPVEDVIAETDTCWVTAPLEATLPGYVCVSLKSHAIEPYELDDDARAAFFADAMAVARGVAKAVRPVKMNYEIHGNTIPHLHMHLFPRAPGDLYVGFVITSRVHITRTPEQIEAIALAVRAALTESSRLR
jgi:diadenosine tetraphosphate (Ap4A) HIT family hydrolase